MSTVNAPITELKFLPIGDLRASKTNPRKHFGDAAMKELSDSIGTQGIRQPILARPLAGETPYEIVAGERRYRGAKVAGLAVVPCIVAVMSDREALEIQVVENLQREDLTELEEAESYQSMLNLRENGEACYTVQTLALRFGISDSKIYQRMNLLKLSEDGRQAMEQGKLGARQAVLIGRIPDPVAREQALDKVLHPQHSDEPLTYRETEELIRKDFMQSLNGAPFKLTDATLVPEAGPCSTCPMMTDNCRHLYTADETAGFKKQKLCTSPGCFRAKLQAVWAKQTERAEKEGMTVLNDRESRDVFPEWQGSGEIGYNSPYVLIGEKPATHLLKPEVVDTVGTWASLLEVAESATATEALNKASEKIRKDPDLDKAAKAEAIALIEKNPPKGVTVPRLLARDQRGAARELVDRQLAIVAIEQGGDPIFLGKTGSSARSGGDDFAKERKKELEAAKLRLATSLEGMTQMHAALVAAWVASPVWEALFEIAMGHAGADGLWLIGKWKGLKFGTHNTGKEEAVAKWAMELPANERQALVPLLLIGQQMKWGGLGESFEQVAQGANLGLDLDDIARKVKAALKGEKAAKKAKAKEPKAKKQSKAEKIAEQAAHYEWNENGVAVKPQISTVVGDLPDGVKCDVRTAFAPDGKWRVGVDLGSRTKGHRGTCHSPNMAGKAYRDVSAAATAGFNEALMFFKDDPAVFKLVSFSADPEVVAEIEGEGGGAPVTSVPPPAPVTMDPALLEQWVKAACNGMPHEEIARSYGVPVEDVTGALSGFGPAPKAAKRKRVEITAELKQEVHNMVCAGRTGAEIAYGLSISLPSVQNIKKELGLVKARTTTPEPAAAKETPAETTHSAIPAAKDERYSGLPASTHTAIDLINAGKTTHEIAAGAGITLAEVIKLRQQLKHGAAEQARGVESAA